MKTMLAAFTFGVLGLFFQSTGKCTAEEPAKDCPELAALSHYVGNWQDEMTIKFNDKETTYKGSCKAKWTLNGRYLEQSSQMASEAGSPPTQVKAMMTYDANKKTYRTWMYFSTGNSIEYKGTWDEAAKTMTSVSVDAETGKTSTIVANFATEGVENWTIVDKDKDGKIVVEIKGKNTRTKK